LRGDAQPFGAVISGQSTIEGKSSHVLNGGGMPKFASNRSLSALLL
jgi:hypothetical protein